MQKIASVYAYGTHGSDPLIVIHWCYNRVDKTLFTLILLYLPSESLCTDWQWPSRSITVWIGQVTLEWAEEPTWLHFDVALYIMCIFFLSVYEWDFPQMLQEYVSSIIFVLYMTDQSMAAFFLCSQLYNFVTSFCDFTLLVS